MLGWGIKMNSLELYRLLVLVAKELKEHTDIDDNFLALGKLEYKLLEMVKEL